MTPRTKTPTATNNGTQQTVRKLDIACGQRKQPGYKGMDIAGDADIKWDLNEFPWPIKTGCVKEAFCAHYVEHIPHWRPGWERDGWWLFFDELYRVCAKDAQIRIFHPYVRNDRAFWDPTHVRFITEVTWYYLDKGWREAQGLDHYDVACDFEVVTINTGWNAGLDQRSMDTQNFARTHYWNALNDLEVILKKR